MTANQKWVATHLLRTTVLNDVQIPKNGEKRKGEKKLFSENKNHKEQFFDSEKYDVTPFKARCDTPFQQCVYRHVARFEPLKPQRNAF
jgi:hypothetical protein